MDQACWEAKKDYGVGCLTVAYPLAASEYAQGNCPGIDECQQKLDACVNKYKTGNDQADCASYATSACYSAADYCVNDAAFFCGEKNYGEVCGGLLPFAIGALGLLAFAKKE